jgi:AraC-like DNA-binding protein
MQQSPNFVEAGIVENSVRAVRGDAVPFPHMLDSLKKTVPFSSAIVVSALPRTGLQVVQSVSADELLLRDYRNTLHPKDRLAWQAILEQRALRISQLSGGGADAATVYRMEVLAPTEHVYAAAAPLAGPVLEGYPGAIVVMRLGSGPDFTDRELEELEAFARSVDEAVASVRAKRSEHLPPRPAWAHHLPQKLYIFDSQARRIWPKDDAVTADRSLLSEMQRQTTHLLSREVKSPEVVGRVQFGDSRGDRWSFRAVAYPSYPALADGPVVFFALQPEIRDWMQLQPSDVQADVEMARLVPAMRFMEREFGRGPTLDAIAQSVHLSPFHFHRRFNDLLGLTPKHFMLDCQVEEAKRRLAARKDSLAEIATTCGFAHQSHFTSRFRQATGLTPTRWRRLVGDQSAA